MGSATTAKQFSYTNASASIQSVITATHTAGSTDVVVSATITMETHGSSLNNITRYVCLVINGTTYYGCGSKSGTYNYNSTYTLTGSKTYNVGHYGSGSLTVGVYISASSSSLSSSGTLIWNGKTQTKTSDCSLKTVKVDYGISASGWGPPGKPTADLYVKGGNNVTVRWGASTGGSHNSLTYHIYYQFYNPTTKSWGSWTYWNKTTSTSYTGTLSSLGTWSFKIKAVNEKTAFTDQWSAYSDPYTYTWSNVKNATNFKPTSGSQYQTGSFTLSWTDAEAGINNSVSYYTIDGSRATSGSGSRTVAPGKSAKYVLKTVGARGDTSSGVSYTVISPKLTFATTAPTLSNVTNGVFSDNITVTWKRTVSTYPNTFVVKYMLQQNVDGNGWVNSLSSVTEDTSVQISAITGTGGVAYGSLVKFRVIAYLYNGTAKVTETDATRIYTNNSAEVRRGYLPDYITSVSFNNDWYNTFSSSDDNSDESSEEYNSYWVFHSDGDNPESMSGIINNSSNIESEFTNGTNLSTFTFGKHTQFTVTLPPSTLHGYAQSKESLSVTWYKIDGTTQTEIVEFSETDSSHSYIFTPNIPITKLELELSNVYNNTAYVKRENSNKQTKWVITNIRVPATLDLKTDGFNRILTFNSFGDNGKINYNYAIKENTAPLYTTIDNIVLATNSPQITDTASRNKNTGFKVEVFNSNNSTWEDIILEDNDITRIGFSLGDRDCYTEDGIFFPDYTNVVGTGWTDSRAYQALNLNVNLVPSNNQWHWLPSNINLKTLNTTKLTLTYRIAPINKYAYADAAGDVSQINLKYTEISTDINTSVLLTLPSNPQIYITDAPSKKSISIGSYPYSGRVFNNGVSTKKSYLLFDFYAGFDSNEFYSGTSERYIKIGNEYYLKDGFNDPCTYNITIFTCVDKTLPRWINKYEQGKILPIKNQFEGTFGCIAYSSFLEGENIIKYRGWYQLNLTDSLCDEFIKIGIKPVLSSNDSYTFPEEYENSENWLLYDGNEPCNIWVASTYSPSLGIKKIEAINNTTLKIEYNIFAQQTGSTYQFGYKNNKTPYNCTPSDQQLRVEFIYTQTGAQTSSTPFGTDIVNLAALPNSNETYIKVLNSVQISESESLNDAFSYTFDIFTDILGSQYDLNTDQQGLPIYE